MKNAALPTNPNLNRPWQIVYVEDDRELLNAVKEYFHEQQFEFGLVHLEGFDEFEKAIDRLRERRVDILILDVFRGETGTGDKAGIEVLGQWKESGFTPVILHTALPGHVEGHVSHFVRLVPKSGAGALKALENEIGNLIENRVPQIHRNILEHFERCYREYMWGFAQDNWVSFEEVFSHPDFLRLLVRRLEHQFSHSQMVDLIGQVYPDAEESEIAPDKVHPTEFYIKPPISEHPQLGDILKLGAGDQEGLYVIAWPSCDLVLRSSGRKTDRVLCIRAVPIEQYQEHKAWLDSRDEFEAKQQVVQDAEAAGGAQDNIKREAEKAKKAIGSKETALMELMKNTRKSNWGSSERFHFLPQAWDIPASVLDFQDIHMFNIDDVLKADCVATLASPFAESVSSRLLRYLGRLGTPDLDIDYALNVLRRG